MHSLSAPHDLYDTRVQKLGHKLCLPIGSRLLSRQVPWPPIWRQPSWLTSHEAQSLNHKDTGRPQSDSETWAWVLSYKVKEMGWAAFRQKRGLNPAHHTPWARTSVLFCTFWVQKFPPFWMVVERIRKYSFSQLVQTRKIGENILCTSQWSLLMA